VPRTEPANYVPPRDSAYQVYGNPRVPLEISPLALAPYALESTQYRIRFDGQLYDPAARYPVYRFTVTSAGGDTVQAETRFTVKIDSVTDTIRFVPTVLGAVITNISRVVRSPGDTVIDTTYSHLPIAQMTLKLKLDRIPTQFFDRFEVQSGNYPVESLAVRDDASNNKSLWAYRGSNYRIVWQERAGARTCEVYDLENERIVPYRAMRPLLDPDSADGWCFQTTNRAADTLAPDQTRFFSLCGCRFQFRPGQAASPLQQLPDPGDTWLVHTKVLTPVPIYAAYDVEFKPMRYAPTVSKLNVKVVPNPYLVRNEWERHPDFRKLKFINLPNHCFIYIYNLAGDLVKTLEHRETKPSAGGLPNQFGGDEDWDLLNETRQKPAPGVYIFHVQSDQGNQTGKFVVVY